MVLGLYPMKKGLALLGILMVFGLIGASEASAWYNGWGFWPSYGAYGYHNYYAGGYGYGGGRCPGYYGSYSYCGGNSRGMQQTQWNSNSMIDYSRDNLQSTYNLVGGNPYRYGIASNAGDYNAWNNYQFQGYGNPQRNYWN